MKQSRISIIILILIPIIIGIIADMLSGSLEGWLSKFIGPNYTLILGGLLFLLLIVLIVWSIREQSVNKERASDFTGPDKSASLPEEELPSAVVDQIKKTIPNNLKKAIELAISQPILEKDGTYFLAQWNNYEGKMHGNMVSNEELTRELNTITNGFLNLIENYSPTKPKGMNVDTSSNESNDDQINLFRRLTGPKDRKLEDEYELLGREADLTSIFAYIDQKVRSKIQVTGAPGLGKTAFCKAVLKRILKQYSYRVYWIDVEQIKTKAELQGTFAQMVGLPAESKIKEIVVGLATLTPAYFYLDNLETVLEDTETEQLLAQLTEVNDTFWLVSSRDEIAQWFNFSLNTLSDRTARQLFKQVWERHGGAFFEETLPIDLRRFIHQDLGNHPLSIILTGSHATEYPNYQSIIKGWKSLKPDVGTRYLTQGKSRLDNLSYSLRLSVERLMGHPGAIQLWGIAAFFPEGIDEQAESELETLQLFSVTDRGILLSRSILLRTKGRLELLPPLQRFVLQELNE